MTPTFETLEPGHFVVGVDLGQAADYTAVAVAEARQSWQSGGAHLHFGFLHRFPLGTPYPNVVDGVAKILAQLPARRQRPALVVDATGVGRPVVDLMRARRLAPVAVTITGGDNVTQVTPEEYRVPKRLLASLLQVALQTKRIKVAAALPLTSVLTRELSAFRVKVSVSGNESFEAWREQDHDDLVLATAIAVWSAEHRAKAFDTSYFWVG